VGEGASAAPERVSQVLGNGAVEDTFPVKMSPEIVQLLSEHLYTSATKAIEELVVNAYDADAAECRIALLLEGVANTPLEMVIAAGESPAAEATDDADPASSSPENPVPSLPPAPDGLIAVFDDGEGMDIDKIHELWSVGRSSKGGRSEPTPRFGRLVVGKFGIGKIATYAVANRITYVASRAGVVRHVTCDFRRFRKAGRKEEVKLKIRKVEHLAELLARPDMASVLARLGLKAASLVDGSMPNWTLCLLDDLKDNAAKIRSRDMRWVLRTAMPLGDTFRVYLDGAQQTSSKVDQNILLEFDIKDLDQERINDVNLEFETKVKRTATGLIEPTLFPSGITGSVLVTENPLPGGKSDLLGRSNGFFIKVRDRVVNPEEPLFHNQAQSHSTFSRFRAELHFDDLHGDLLASREAVGSTRRRDVAAAIAKVVFTKARNFFDNYEREKARQGQTTEENRTTIDQGLVERPLADVLLASAGRPAGGGADGDWMYIDPVDAAANDEIVERLYNKRVPYRFPRVNTGRERPIARFNPNSAEFSINEDHQFVMAFDSKYRELIEVIATAEVMLEVYLAESGVPPHLIGDVLSRRDALLRSMASERIYSPPLIATMLRESAADYINLELALVAAVRVLGFQVKHIGGPDEPDGLALFVDSDMSETRIILESKASGTTPQLGHLDFATLRRHAKKRGAEGGVLLVAPRYPAEAREDGAASENAKQTNVSCWTVEVLAGLVEKADDFRVSAKQVAKIVRTCSTPASVKAAVEALLTEDNNPTPLYAAIMDALRSEVEGRIAAGDRRDVSGIRTLVNLRGQKAVTRDVVKRALVDLEREARGLLEVQGDTVLFLSDLETITRKVSRLTGQPGPPHTRGTFKKDDNQPMLPE
jgi:hypothetical protein